MKRRRLEGLILALALGLGLSMALAQETSVPGVPDMDTGKGVLTIDVKFAADGTVSACRIARSNVPYALEVSTVDYIRRKWVNGYFAGETVRFPVTFDELPWYAKQWGKGLVPPPNFLPADDPGRKLKLRVTFGPDGWVRHVQVMEPSGLDDVDRETAFWVNVHWHDPAYQGQTLDAPFIFKTPAVPKPAVAKAPPKPEPKPAAPEEPAAPPAVRVQ
ncbi:MAG TPA: hypothetical protein VHY09_00985 [Candidatus Methylacidiphilales bacterium]|jgi:hypothetical protein|nr:hypothetical protein [Candidatus Methylacidiphilales bacterium]